MIIAAETPGVGVIIGIAFALFALFFLLRAVRIVPQQRRGIVERLGKYHRTLEPGLALVVPFIDKVQPLIDLREQVVTFPPQPVITADNVTVQIDTVIYFTVTDPKAVTYEIANPLQAIEQLTITTLRNVVGGLTLEGALTGRDTVNDALRLVLDQKTGQWGIRIATVEIKAIDPPMSIQEAMEKQMRAERDKRATILTAEGSRESQILTAEGERQARILRAEGERQSAILTAQGERESKILEAEGEAKAIANVFDAIHQANPDQALLAYQYLQMLPKLADGDASKIFVIPTEFTEAAKGLANLGFPGVDEALAKKTSQ
ncbi:MAG: SPFH/Band 7/PHB domain protein [Solirubrobacteraceae bacterium]|nr:SPFH/Band 7/PHB domain protein [Solirubrobacteraceae bacterium]